MNWIYKDNGQLQLKEKIEKVVREQKIMEKHYGIDLIPADEPIFTTSQETDVWEFIMEGYTFDEIITQIKQW